MEALIARIEGLRLSHTNTDGRHFIPESALLNLMSYEAVRDCLSELDIAHEYREELSSDISVGGRKVFAVLLVIRRGADISSFLRSDHFQQSRIDDRLPYRLEALETIFGPNEKTFAAARFSEKQWEFCIPNFSNRLLPRNLDTQIILPFLNETLIGKGSLGRVWETEIHPECQNLTPGTLKFVRKEFDVDTEEDEEAFTRELRNLSLLTFLQHDNIINLLCVYAHRRQHNLVFPIADHGSLEQMLRGEENNLLRNDFALLPALVELTSALNMVHNFTSDTLDLQLIGCHHDLAPRNILVHGNRFLLADFGISRFKSASERSTTSFKDVRGSCIAPECQLILDGQIASHRVTRASDIWSYGCILTDIVTFLLFGPAAVEDFRQRRKHDVLPFLTWYRFHCGPDSPNPEVHIWLARLEQKASVHLKRLVKLIRVMLSMSPALRPTSSTVLRELQNISIDTLVASVTESYARASSRCNNLEYQMERRRFRGWQQAFGRAVHELDSGIPGRAENMITLQSNYTAIVNELKNMKQNLADVESANPEMQFRACVALQILNSNLLLLLPQQAQAWARSFVIDQILQSTDDELVHAGVVMQDSKNGYEATNMLITLRRLTLLANEKKLTTRDEMFLAFEDFDWRDSGDKHCMAVHKISHSGGTKSMLVYVEWLFYNARWGDDQVGKELRDRVAMIAGLLSQGKGSQISGVMACQGFVHDPTKPAFGLVYQTNLSAESEDRRSVIDLLHMLEDRRSTFRLSLEDRFKLATELARAIHVFHQLGWLHRRLNSTNVIFFSPVSRKRSDWARTPFLVGFTASRQNQDEAFSHGHDRSGHLNDYQDPEYLQTGASRYCQTYDYYSLGILFLEIGLWSSLAQITKSASFQGLAPSDFKQLIIDKVIPQLAFTMGSAYMNATLRCVKREFDGASKADDQAGFSVAISRQFEETVVQRIDAKQLQIA